MLTLVRETNSLTHLLSLLLSGNTEKIAAGDTVYKSRLVLTKRFHLWAKSRLFPDYNQSLKRQRVPKKENTIK
jgi:hypothetical protein